ncbi:flagellar hook-associated protein FlgL [Clostridium sp. BL-8]|uniref:flagellar hook-associated protein FlgL n=1 Tax=Clostridium sp. BL-8 TaxID=349938 RepID=UPI00098C5555|nr:flagellar hook-associated protein FlgL [Clostridium sp. BL-8]OOM79985.1 flagellin 1 [Clostridium sp. BL-8]
MYRITNSMLNTNYLRNLQTNYGNMSVLQNQLSSGKNIDCGAEDPIGASKIMSMNDGISANTQYSSNIKSINHLLDTTDTALSETNNVLSRIRDLLVKAGNGTYTEDEISSIKDEVVACVKELGDQLNTSYAGNYIFGGSKTDSKSITVDSNGNMSYIDSNGTTINVYLDAGGNVVNDAISNNTNYNSATPIYLDSNGKVTTDSTTNGVDNTLIVQGSSLYVDKTTGVVSTSPGANTNPLLLRDELYQDQNGNITAAKTTENKLITSDDELLYLTSDGKVTTNATTSGISNTLIPTGTTLYEDSTGRVTTTNAVGNKQIDTATPIYTDELGNVTTSSVTVNTQISQAASVTTIQVSQYTPGSGYTQTTINGSGDVYMDSRGDLTNSGTTDLSQRQSTLEDLWNNAYIDPATQNVVNSTPTSSTNKEIHLYKDSNGNVTTSPGGYPANEEVLSGTTLYRDANGNVTTMAKDSSGNANNSLQPTDTVYVDLNGNVTTNQIVNNKAVSVRDDLSIDTTATNAQAKAVIGNVTPPNTVIPSDQITLYTDSNGYITNNGTGNTKILLTDSLYIDNYENITVSETRENTLIDSDDKLYQDANGNVSNSATNTLVDSKNTLYKDAFGRVTTLKGQAPPNEPIDLKTTQLYTDSKGNITTEATDGSVANTAIDSSKTVLYKDVNGDLTTVQANTLITSDVQLYDDGNGNITTQPIGITRSTTQLYVDTNGNVTNVPIGSPATNALPSGQDLYVDANGNVVKNSTTAGVQNTPIPSTTTLYIDGSGQVKTNLLKTGESLYADSNGKIITSRTTTNTELTADDDVYVDAAGDLTLSSTTANSQITVSDIRNLQNELKDPSTTPQRKTEINQILNNGEVSQLAQVDSDLYADISDGVSVNYNVSASDLLEFKDSSGNNVNAMSILSTIIQDLGTASDKTATASDKSAAIANLNGADLTQFDEVIDNFTTYRSKVGTMQNRMDTAANVNDDQNYNMTASLSDIQDIDIAEKEVYYSSAQTVYKASLQVSSQVLKMTLLDYL